MKDGHTHLAHKPEHAVDLDTGIIVAAALIPLTKATQRRLRAHGRRWRRGQQHTYITPPPRNFEHASAICMAAEKISSGSRSCPMHPTTTIFGSADTIDAILAGTLAGLTILLLVILVV
jgi:hypothetical protein